MQKKNINPWVSYGHRRIKKNQNWLVFLQGGTGTGKSWTSLSLAEQLDPNFKVENICFDAEYLFKIIRSKKLKKGAVIIIEEMGVMAGHKQWYSKINLAISYLFQTFRRNNYIVIMNAPFMKFVDKSVRVLFHTLFETIQVSEKHEKTILKCYNLLWTSKKPDPYTFSLNMVLPGQEGVVKINRIAVDKPSDGIIKKYEKYRDTYQEELEEHLELTLSMTKKSKKQYECIACNHKWFPRNGSQPRQCPGCGTKMWKSMEIVAIS